LLAAEYNRSPVIEFIHTFMLWVSRLPFRKKLMRHADIRSTMNVYGDVVTDEMQRAPAKVAVMALGRAN
jgi:integrase